MALGRAAKNLGILIATKSYGGLKSIGKVVKKAPGKIMDKIENVDRMKYERHQRIKEDNFGPTK